MKLGDSSTQETSVRGEFTIVLGPYDPPALDEPSVESYLQQLQQGD